MSNNGDCADVDVENVTELKKATNQFISSITSLYLVLLIVSCVLWVMGCVLSVMGCGAWVVGCGLWGIECTCLHTFSKNVRCVNISLTVPQYMKHRCRSCESTWNGLHLMTYGW